VSAAKSYVAPFEIGDVIGGEATGVVIASLSSQYTVGDSVVSACGWQTHCVCDDADKNTYKVDITQVPLSANLGTYHERFVYHERLLIMIVAKSDTTQVPLYANLGCIASKLLAMLMMLFPQFILTNTLLICSLILFYHF
jgi:D-arabinose 1-dehydrogenase-like Zn-dependent alcohol dehydrogenase